MSEHPSETSQEYLDSRNPDNTGFRVKDVEKAHAMAVASKEDEEAAAAIRHIASKALDMGDPDLFQEVVAEAIDHKDDPDQVPVHFKSGLEHAELGDLMQDLSVDGIAETIQEHQRYADKMAEFAGDGYDKLKATKR
jgi:hypothetical protein